jgi:hypothetical protein
VSLAVLYWVFSTIPIAAASEGVDGCGCSLASPFTPFQFVLELVSFAAVFYLMLAGKKQRRHILGAATLSIHRINIFLRELRPRITSSARQATRTFSVLAQLGRWLTVLLIALVSILPNVNAQVACAQCGPTDPFQPLRFALLVSVYGLVFWLFLNPKLPRAATHSIYQALRFHAFHLSALPEGDPS